MKIHRLGKIKKLKRLRQKGYSINELVAKLSIPKTTVWYHVQGVSILPRYVTLLKSKRGGSKERKQKNLEIAKEKAGYILNSPYREHAIALAMLYWGEGSKKSCEFINSDGKMVQFYIKILKKLFNISEDDIKITIRMFSGMNQRECLNYWSYITNIPKNKFCIRINDGGTRGRTKCGMCRITLKRGSKVLKIIHSLIEQIPNKII